MYLNPAKSVHVPKTGKIGTCMYLKLAKSVHDVPKTDKIGTCTQRRITSANVPGVAITSANVAGDAITSANVASAPRLRRPMLPVARLHWLLSPILKYEAPMLESLALAMCLRKCLSRDDVSRDV